MEKDNKIQDANFFREILLAIANQAKYKMFD